MGRWQQSSDQTPSSRTRKAVYGNRNGKSLFQSVESTGPLTTRRSFAPASTGVPDASYSSTSRPSTVPNNPARSLSPTRASQRALPVSERYREDRDLVLRLQDRFNTSKHAYLQKLFRAYDPSNSGALDAPSFKSALSRLNLGLNDDALGRIVARLQPKDGSSKIPYQALFDWAANMAPLGSRQMDNGREPAPGATQQHSHDQHGLQGQNGKEPAAAAATQQHSHDQQGRSSGLHGVSSVAAMTASRPQTTPAGVARGNDADAGEHDETLGDSGGNVRTRAPWEAVHGPMRLLNWQLRPQGLAGVVGPAEPGSYEEKKQDALLVSLLSERLTQSLDKLRATFRRWDMSRNGQLNKTEFVGALEALHMQVPRPQLERLFDMADVNGSGEVDYEEFAKTFENSTLTHTLNPKEQAKGTAGSGAQRVSVCDAVSPPVTREEADGVVRSSLAQQLCVKLASKASAAHAVFAAYDVNGDGYLSLSELTRCCQTLVPGLGERDVAALLTAHDPSGDGYLNYKEFVGRLVDAAPPHPRMMHAHMAAQQGVGGHMEGRDTWGHSPLFTPTGPFPNTVWSRDDLPAPGYTGVLKPTLREPPRTVRPNDEERRRELHAAAVQPLVDSLLLTGMSSDLQHNTNTTSRNNTLDNKSAHAELATAAEVASRGTATLGADSSSVTQSEKEARVAAWAPYDVQGAPPLPAQPGGKAAVAGARAAHAASAGAEAQHKPLKRPVTEHAARRGEIPWRWGNPAGDPDCAWGSANGNLTTWSGDSSNLATRSVSLVPPRTAPEESQSRTKGKMRFAFMSHLDTSHITRAAPGTSHFCDPCDQWVRKSDSDFMAYQTEDRLRKQRKEQLAAERDAVRAAAHAEAQAARAAREQGNDQTRLEIKGLVKARYTERCAAFEDARSNAHAPHSHAMFARQAFYTDHLRLDNILTRA